MSVISTVKTDLGSNEVVFSKISAFRMALTERNISLSENLDRAD